MNEYVYVPGWTNWMLSLPMATRMWLAKRWRAKADKCADRVWTERTKARRYEAMADWIEPESL